jgi:uncharacterized protein (DUF2147 family)
MKYGAFGILLFFMTGLAAQNNGNAIVGKWMSTDNKVLVEIYKSSNDFRAKVLWFNDDDDKSQPFYARRDTKNPDISLRNRKISGMEVLHGLTFDPDEDRWEDGKIYDAKSGKTWSASVWITSENLLKVRGFWHFEFLGETMKFKRI